MKICPVATDHIFKIPDSYCSYQRSITDSSIFRGSYYSIIKYSSVMKIVNVKLDWIFSKYGGAFVTGMAAEYTHTSSCTEPDLPQTAIIGLPLCIVT